MKLSRPRITPLTEAEWTDEQRKVLEPVYKEGRVYNVLGTLSRHWEASKKFGVWAYHVMGDTSKLAPENGRSSFSESAGSVRRNMNGDNM